MIKVAGIDPGQQGAVVMVEVQRGPTLRAYLWQPVLDGPFDVENVRLVEAWKPDIVVVEGQRPRGAKEKMVHGIVSVMKEASKYVGAFAVLGIHVVEMYPIEAKAALGMAHATEFKQGAVDLARRLLPSDVFESFAFGDRGGKKLGRTDAFAYAVAGAVKGESK